MFDTIIKMYKNTGFTPNNIPHSTALLDAVGTPIQLEASSYRLLEAGTTVEIDISAHYDNIRDVDYCTIGNRCYWADFKMVNAKMARFNLTLDALTTIGINNLDITSGWCERRHVKDDSVLNNNINEGFTPKEPMVIDSVKIIGQYGNDKDEQTCIVVSTVDLSGELSAQAKTFVDSATNLQVVVPNIPAFGVDSQTQLTVNGQTFAKKLPQVTFFNHGNTNVRKNLNAVRALGIEQALLGSYIIPNNFITNKYENDGVITSLGSVETNVNSGINPIYEAGIKNKKVFTPQFSTVTLGSVTGASVKEFPIDEVADSANNINITLFADLSVDGRPYAKPTQYMSNYNNHVQFGLVAGNDWQKQPIAFSQPSGNAITNAYSKRAQNRELRNNVLGLAGTGVKAYAMAEGGASASAVSQNGIPFLSNIYNHWQNTNQLAFENMVVNMPQPELIFAPANGLENYLGNCFIVYHTHLSTNDAKRFDNYLSEFGYATSEPLTKECFNCRKNHNYVKATGVNIAGSVDVSMQIKMAAISQIEQGVRIWHVKPSAETLRNNPII